MKTGDLVRVTIWEGEKASYRLGLLVKYFTWEKIATVLVDGTAGRYRADEVTRAGRKDQIYLGGTL